MEIIGTDVTEKQRKTKNTMAILIFFIVLLFIASVCLAGGIYYLKLTQFKLEIDGNITTGRNVKSDLFIFDGDDIYVSLEDISKLIDYKYYNGGYKQYTEDVTKGYLECDNEVVTFEKDSDTIYKTPVDELDYTYYSIDKPVINKNNKLYMHSEGLSTACNIQLSYNSELNKITIYTLPYLTNYYVKKYTNAAISENFNNQKALLYGLLVVQNVDNTDNSVNKDTIRYGVNDLQNNEVVGMKYKEIEFIEGTEEFIVKTGENKVGIITSKGETKVNPQYDSLKQIDKDLNLYLATTNNKNGIIEKNGKILIYLEFDQIGIDPTQFPTNDIKNRYILFNNAIPVKQNGLWGLYNIKGNMILPIKYKCFGCISNSSSSSKAVDNLLVIPEVDGIVVGEEYDIDNKKQVYYGIVDSKGNLLITTALSTIYSVTSTGQKEYTMVNNGNSYDVIEFIRLYVWNENDNTNNTDNSTNNSDETIEVNDDENTAEENVNEVQTDNQDEAQTTEQNPTQE